MFRFGKTLQGSKLGILEFELKNGKEIKSISKISYSLIYFETIFVLKTTFEKPRHLPKCDRVSKLSWILSKQIHTKTKGI